MLNNYLLSDEDYILARYVSILKKKKIQTVEDLLFDFPIKYEDYTVHSIHDAILEVPTILEGTIVSKVTVNYLKSKLSTVVFQLDVEGRKIRCTIFNRIYLKGKLNYGSVIRVQGKFYQNMNNFTVNNLMICDELDRNIIPIYHIKDIGEAKYLEIISMVYRRYKDKIEETLPQKLLNKYHFASLKKTIYTLHLSENLNDINEAIRRIKYEELLKYQLSMKYLHYMRENDHNCPIINYDNQVLEKLEASLIYELTDDQKKVISEILKDLKAPYAMNRLLQGEVGSGKTIVAIMSIMAVVSGGYQAVLMCPTEILSKQHYQTISQILKEYKEVKMGLLTGSTSLKQRKEIIDKIASGDINVIIGTHALFQKDIDYPKLGIVIADEEHRFGVRQRVLIKNKGLDVNYLKMSATPIPRSLAISAYGDTDISIIKTMPKNRKEVITKYIDNNHKKDVINHMKEELQRGHQIYVVTPLIEESDALDTANATEIYQNMVKYFDKIATVGLIHGRLKTEEKEDIMQKFLNNEIQILVATSVIEVGVNVVNATTIVILGAERFGVATLHQLRGRVMRSDSIPYCFFIANNPTDSSIERLKMVEQNTDGFKLAEYDLINRGPGEFFGEKQSGAMNFKYASLKDDTDLLELANSDSEEIINDQSTFNDDEYKILFDVAKKNYQMKQTKLD
jgi:ATP-dependent DNA helicase RecG